MICLPVMAVSNKQAREYLALAATLPVDMYELRFDRIQEKADIEGLIHAADRPVVATCRSVEQGGFFSGNVRERAALLQRAIDAGAGYVDAEEDVLPQLKTRNGVVLIASWHDFSGTPENLDEIATRMEKLPCDWIKFAVMATKLTDNQKVLQTVAQCEKPVVGIAMGEMGLPSRILGPAWGSQITFASLAAGHESAPGQLSAADLVNFYRVDRITRDTNVYGLLGNPVGQSQGYKLHNNAFVMAGIDAVYIPFLCLNANEFTHEFADALNIKGVSVTIPHKEAVLSFAQRRTDAVVRVGAVNTLAREQAGWLGDNTDFQAVVSGIKEAAHEHDVTLEGKPALLIGGGGAARAIGAALEKLGCLVHITGRNNEKVAGLAMEKDWTQVEWENREQNKWAVVANSTPVGMKPDTESTPFASNGWRKNMIAFDAVHCPSRTRFIREAEKAEAWTVNGMDMFIRQAALQFKLWTGQCLPSDCVLPLLADQPPGSCRSARSWNIKIALIGMMASGKTTLGKQLSKTLDVPLVDIDEEIERKAGMTIPHIFKTLGETEFRRIEYNVIAEQLDRQGTLVLSLGGGAFIQEGIRKLLRDRAVSLYLRVRPDELVRRLEKTDTQNRPLLAAANNWREKTTRLAQERDPVYMNADVIFPANENDVVALNERLAGVLKKLCWGGLPPLSYSGRIGSDGQEKQPVAMEESHA